MDWHERPQAIYGITTRLNYDASITPLWMSGTAANTNSRLVLQADGNVVVYSADGRALWDRFSNPAGFVP